MVEGDMSDMEESPAQKTVAGAVTALTLLVGFGLLAAGVSYFWVAFVVGFAGLLPMSVGAVQLYERRQDEAGTTEDDAIDELRRRYARGELTEVEFEQRVEQLIETEDETPAGDATTRVRRERESE